MGETQLIKNLNAKIARLENENKILKKALDIAEDYTCGCCGNGFGDFLIEMAEKVIEKEGK